MLTLGVAALLGTASPWVAAGEVQAEGAAYGGSTTGQWICGPVGRARYAGAAAAVRLSERPLDAERGPGLNARLAAAAEYEQVQLVNHEGDASGPPDRVLFGGSVRAGHQGRYFGFTTGFGAFQGWESASSNAPTLVWLPELELAFGKPSGGRGFLGFGKPWLTSQRRPALFYGGGAVRFDERHELVFGTGAFRAGAAAFEALALRVDAQLCARLSEKLELRIGSSLSGDFDYGEEPGFESSLSVVTEL